MVSKTAGFVLLLAILVGGFFANRRTQAQQLYVDVTDYRITMFQMLGAAMTLYKPG